MVQVTKEQKGSAQVIRLTGTIEESVDFAQLLGNLTGEVRVNTKGVTRINSVGVKAWIQYFQGQASKGTKLVFEECSTAIVEQINLISNFSVGGQVESIYVPYACPKCRTEFTSLFKTADLKKSGLAVPKVKCPKGDADGEFDDVPEEYLGFLGA